METVDSILAGLLARTGCGYLVVDRNLEIAAASETVARFTAAGTDGLTGQALVKAFPEFQEYTPRLEILFAEPAQQVRFRIKRGEHLYVMVSSRAFTYGDAPALLVLFEDITLLVLRTEILGRRVKELESRSQNLEKALFSATDATKTEKLTPNFDLETGLYDLDYVIRRLVEEEGFSRRWQRPLSVVVLRLAAGGSSLTGDVLKSVAGIIRQNLRSMDTLGLLDASGFILVLPQTAGEDARTSVDRVLERMRKQPEGAAPDLDIRVGIAELSAKGEDTALQVFERAKQHAAGA
jgi:PleD family two-component response regulator